MSQDSDELTDHEALYYHSVKLMYVSFKYHLLLDHAYTYIGKRELNRVKALAPCSLAELHTALFWPSSRTTISAGQVRLVFSSPVQRHDFYHN